MSKMNTRTLSIVAAVGVAAVLAGAGAASANNKPAAGLSANSAAPPATDRGAAGQGAARQGAAAAQDAAAGHDAAGHGAAGPITPLSATCGDSQLPPHTGFQDGPACVSTQFGEVGAAEDNPQLLITDAPDTVAAGQPFTIQVSTRNLVRDRFLAATQGGYYVERSTLDEDGLVRGHFHTACRVLDNPNQAPQPDRQDVFVATEDSRGGAKPDTVTVQIPGLPTAGEAQCAAWAGDGSHRMPMMVFANQIPAFDSVRIKVTGAAEPAGAGKPAAAATPADTVPPADAGRRPNVGQRPSTGQATDDGHGADTRRRAGTEQPADVGQRTDTRRPAGERAGAGQSADPDQRTGTGQAADTGQ